MGIGHSGAKPRQAVKFYRDLKKTKTMAEEQGENLKQQIKLSAKIEKADVGSSYIIYISNTSNFNNCLLQTSPTQADFSGVVTFQEFVVTEYYFEIEQPIHVKVCKNGSSSAYHEISTTLGTIFGSRNNTFTQKANSGNETIVLII